MGQFSWKCSDTGNPLLCCDIVVPKRYEDDFTKKAFLLIPKEFGGGSYKVDNNYEGYGVFYDEDGNEHDAFEELAKWNGVVGEDKQKSRENAIDLYYIPKNPDESKYADENHNTEETMKYPLKIVQYECAYEDAEPCTDDPNQGWGEGFSLEERYNMDEEDDDFFYGDGPYEDEDEDEDF